MTITTHERDQLRKALGVYVNEAPPAPDWQDWEIALASDVPKRPRLKGPTAALAAAAIVFVVIGAVGVMLRTTPNSPLDGLGGEPPTWGDWFDGAVAAAEPIGDDPTILLAALGPDPEFDPSNFGEEQRLESTTPSAIPSEWWTFLLGPSLRSDPTVAEDGKILIVGRVASSILGAGTAAHNPYDVFRTPIVDGLCQFVLGFEPDLNDPPDDIIVRSTTTCSERTDPLKYGTEFDLSMVNRNGDLRSLSVAIVVPQGTSVVAIDSAGTRAWQRPRAGMALFVGDFTGGEIRYTALSASGDVLIQGTNEIRILAEFVGTPDS